MNTKCLNLIKVDKNGNFTCKIYGDFMYTRAAEALESLTSTSPDVLISDIGMPEVDGYDLIRQVRGLPRERGGKVPAIALTAYTRTEDRLQSLRAGYDMHVPKPVELAELVAVAATVVRRKN